jgi:predicted metal-binding membrane protein
MASALASRRAFLGVLAVIFAASATATIVGSVVMSDMDGMPMPGEWTMSTTWMRMPGQSWAGAAAAFLGMWIVMMMAMMLPALAPMLWRYRQSIDRLNAGRANPLAAVVACGYFSAWGMLGLVVYAFGAALAALAMAWPGLSRGVPMLAGWMVVAAGVLQLSPWKMRRLACCRSLPARRVATTTDPRAAWRLGLRLGLDCCRCCANQMAVLLAFDVMDLRAMAAVTAAITLERLVPGERAAHAVGVVVIVAGLILIARATGPA